MSLFDKFAKLAEARAALGAEGPSAIATPIESVESASRGRIAGREVILAGTNNYLGLTFDPDVIAAGREALERLGSGTTGSRMANGSYAGHRALEAELAAAFGWPSAIVFSTGYQANLGTLSGLAGDGDYLLVDADSHASIYDGCRLSRAQTVVFRHNDPDNLDRRLSRLGDRASNALVVVEGLYSMLGDQPPLEEFVEVKKRHGAWLVVDEAHSFGVFGERGLGLGEAAGLLDDIDFVVGTFSKSLAGIGGFCVSRHPELELLRLASRPYIFTASPSPAVIASTRVALDKVLQGQALRERLHRNIRRLYEGAEAMGYRLGSEQPGPVAALILPDRATALAHWQGLLEAGVYANLMIPPATPAGLNLLRISMSAAHSDEDVDRILAALQDMAAAMPSQAPSSAVSA
ncbi:serine palmitoyltransferase [Wenzhouxiangella marina]|uniref:8-amino-7-oxononanoate synthase n=1 Tax=Wenzhouxiangella marina TaxID=1579979 RepID=A0A0K0XWT4_9GAMM|nr:aminotransferase class I/II-fold pyridoxal phosphate-dependent enzyme [Wenzhouxiangella marina]AKS42092.1 Serine palmitoyltransferase [Wenzhouxiangella marina]MBB6086138.1 8-amino-7-oxononanoate synthase [Wenzhouxiangella marina]